MKNKLSKKETQEKVKQLILTKKPENIKKAKKLAMSKNIKLGELKKLYCKKCNQFFDFNSKIRIKKGFKTIRCKTCDFITRWKIK